MAMMDSMSPPALTVSRHSAAMAHGPSFKVGRRDPKLINQRRRYTIHYKPDPSGGDVVSNEVPMEFGTDGSSGYGKGDCFHLSKIPESYSPRLQDNDSKNLNGFGKGSHQHSTVPKNPLKGVPAFTSLPKGQSISRHDNGCPDVCRLSHMSGPIRKSVLRKRSKQEFNGTVSGYYDTAKASTFKNVTPKFYRCLLCRSFDSTNREYVKNHVEWCIKRNRHGDTKVVIKEMAQNIFTVDCSSCIQTLRRRRRPLLKLITKRHCLKAVVPYLLPGSDQPCPKKCLVPFYERNLPRLPLPLFPPNVPAKNPSLLSSIYPTARDVTILEAKLKSLQNGGSPAFNGCGVGIGCAPKPRHLENLYKLKARQFESGPGFGNVNVDRPEDRYPYNCFKGLILRKDSARISTHSNDHRGLPHPATREGILYRGCDKSAPVPNSLNLGPGNDLVGCQLTPPLFTMIKSEGSAVLVGRSVRNKRKNYVIIHNPPTEDDNQIPLDQNKPNSNPEAGLFTNKVMPPKPSVINGILDDSCSDNMVILSKLNDDKGNTDGRRHDHPPDKPRYIQSPPFPIDAKDLMMFMMLSPDAAAASLFGKKDDLLDHKPLSVINASDSTNCLKDTSLYTVANSIVGPEGNFLNCCPEATKDNMPSRGSLTRSDTREKVFKDYYHNFGNYPPLTKSSTHFPKQIQTRYPSTLNPFYRPNPSFRQGDSFKPLPPPLPQSLNSLYQPLINLLNKAPHNQHPFTDSPYYRKFLEYNYYRNYWLTAAGNNSRRLENNVGGVGPYDPSPLVQQANYLNGAENSHRDFAHTLGHSRYNRPSPPIPNGEEASDLNGHRGFLHGPSSNSDLAREEGEDYGEVEVAEPNDESSSFLNTYSPPPFFNDNDNTDRANERDTGSSLSSPGMKSSPGNNGRTFKSYPAGRAGRRCGASNGKHLCLECGKRFNTSYHLKRHSYVHTGLKPYNCQVCAKAFAERSHFVNHTCRIKNLSHHGLNKLGTACRYSSSSSNIVAPVLLKWENGSPDPTLNISGGYVGDEDDYYGFNHPRAPSKFASMDGRTAVVSEISASNSPLDYSFDKSNSSQFNGDDNTLAHHGVLRGTECETREGDVRPRVYNDIVGRITFCGGGGGGADNGDGTVDVASSMTYNDTPADSSTSPNQFCRRSNALLESILSRDNFDFHTKKLDEWGQGVDDNFAQGGNSDTGGRGSLEAYNNDNTSGQYLPLLPGKLVSNLVNAPSPFSRLLNSTHPGWLNYFSLVTSSEPPSLFKPVSPINYSAHSNHQQQSFPKEWHGSEDQGICKLSPYSHLVANAPEAEARTLDFFKPTLPQSPFDQQSRANYINHQSFPHHMYYKGFPSIFPHLPHSASEVLKEGPPAFNSGAATTTESPVADQGIKTGVETQVFPLIDPMAIKHRPNPTQSVIKSNNGVGGTTRVINHTGAHKKIRMKKLHPCDACGKEFRDSYHLKRHYYLHTGKKPFTCPRCNKSYAEQSHLRIHKCKFPGINTHPTLLTTALNPSPELLNGGAFDEPRDSMK